MLKDEKGKVFVLYKDLKKYKDKKKVFAWNEKMKMTLKYEKRG